MAFTPLERFSLVAGALPLLASYSLVELALQLQFAFRPQRMVACGLVLAVTLALVAVPVALVWQALGELTTRTRRLASLLVFAGLLVNLALMGQVLMDNGDGLLPTLMGGLFVGLFVRFALMPVERAGALVRRCCQAGLVPYVALLGTLPWVAADALADGAPQLPEARLAGRSPSHQVPRRVVLVTFDALGAFATSPDGEGAGETPNLARLAAASDHCVCIAGADKTFSSVPALLSGYAPSDIAPLVRSTGEMLREQSVTGIAGYLRGLGYATRYATILVAPVCFGMGGEFDGGQLFDPVFPLGPFNTRAYVPVTSVLQWSLASWRGDSQTVASSPPQPVAVRRTFDAGLAELAAAGDRPTFLWLHCGAPHAPYYDIPPTDWTGALHLDRYRRDDWRTPGVPAAELARRNEAIYRAYLRYVDAQFGLFLDRLAADPAWPSTLLVVTADHGETFRHGRFTHGAGLMDPHVVEVPLVVHRPGQRIAHKVPGLIAHEDVVPTILAEVQGAPATGLRGRPLGAPDPGRIAFCWSLYPIQQGARRSVAAVSGAHALVVDFDDGTIKLVDRRLDPGPAPDLAPTNPAAVERLLAAIRREGRTRDREGRPAGNRMPFHRSKD